VVDGEPVELASRISFKGFMLSDVPNMVFTVGYTNASWTLRADLSPRTCAACCATWTAPKGAAWSRGPAPTPSAGRCST
jgi:cation diffusion facilitator CzcD-associated flavoprotein CzcO